MIIFNTTYHTSKASEENFINWLKEVYIPTALRYEILSNPQLCRIMTETEEEGQNYSLQFHVKDIETLSHWYDKVGSDLACALTTHFKDQVVGFNTLLEIID